MQLASCGASVFGSLVFATTRALQGWCCCLGILEYRHSRHLISFPRLFRPLLEVCGKCGEALSRTQPAVRAMNKLFHSACFCCMSCHRPLQGMQFYDRDGSPECEDCYMVSRRAPLASELADLNLIFRFDCAWRRISSWVLTTCLLLRFRVPWQFVPDVGRRSPTAC